MKASLVILCLSFWYINKIITHARDFYKEKRRAGPIIKLFTVRMPLTGFVSICMILECIMPIIFRWLAALMNGSRWGFLKYLRRTGKQSVLRSKPMITWCGSRRFLLLWYLSVTLMTSWCSAAPACEVTLAQDRATIEALPNRTENLSMNLTESMKLSDYSWVPGHGDNEHRGYADVY